MIPKIIHYVWFGGKPFPPKIQKCVDSWKKYLPDYEIMRWDETTFDINSACEFAKEAYANKKWAFVSDYVRLWALEKYGGIYMDTDIEVLKEIPGEFLENRVTLGTDEGGYLTALMMAEPAHPYIRRCLEDYNTRKFNLGNGKFDMEVNNTSLQANLKDYGYEISNTRQSLREGIEIYPDDFFHVRSLVSGKLNLSPNSTAIHWHTISWVSPKTRFINFMRLRVLVPLLGDNLYSAITKKIKNGKTTF